MGQSDPLGLQALPEHLAHPALLVHPDPLGRLAVLLALPDHAGLRVHPDHAVVPALWGLQALQMALPVLRGHLDLKAQQDPADPREASFKPTPTVIAFSPASRELSR